MTSAVRVSEQQAHRGRGASAWGDFSTSIFNLDADPNERERVTLTCAKRKNGSGRKQRPASRDLQGLHRHLLYGTAWRIVLVRHRMKTLYSRALWAYLLQRKYSAECALRPVGIYRELMTAAAR